MTFTINKSVIHDDDFEIVLPIKLNNGNVGRTTHYGASARRRKAYENLLRSLGLVKTPPEHRQRIVVIRLLGKGEKYYDSDSLGRGNVKEILDSMTACGFWKDDSYKHLEVHYGQDASDRKNGFAVKIQVRKIN